MYSQKNKLILLMNSMISKQNNDPLNIDLYDKTVYLKNKFLSSKTEYEYNEIINSIYKPNTVILHYKVGCPPCKQIRPIWNNVKQYFSKNNNIEFIDIQNSQTDGVKTYPCIKIYISTGKMYIYNKERREDEMIKYIKTCTSNI